MFLHTDKKIIKKDLPFVSSPVAEVKVLIKTRLKPQQFPQATQMLSTYIETKSKKKHPE